jgi:hypothetical protein
MDNVRPTRDVSAMSKMESPSNAMWFMEGPPWARAGAAIDARHAPSKSWRRSNVRFIWWRNNYSMKRISSPCVSASAPKVVLTPRMVLEGLKVWRGRQAPKTRHDIEIGLSVS